MSSLESLTPLFVQYSEQRDAIRSHFLSYSKHLTTLVVSMIGTSGAILGLQVVPSDIRYVVTTTLLVLASVLACLAFRVAKGWATYADEIIKRANRVELLIAQHIADDDFTELVKSGRITATVRSNFYALFLLLSSIAGLGAVASSVCFLWRIPLG